MELQLIRKQFPALQSTQVENAPIFLDGPGGAQVPQSVLDAMVGYLGQHNSNLGGAFHASKKTVELVSKARQAAADFLNAPSADQIVFGPNMTSLTFSFSRAISRDWQEGDEVIVTAADHYSNVSSWQQAAEDKGVIVHQVRINPDDCTLDMEHFQSLLSDKTRLVAVTYASNTTGSINDIKRIVELSHRVKALVYVDAVHYAPHQLIDVQALDCDFLACSAYKFYGPHLGLVYGKRTLLESLTPYKVEPAKDIIPGRWETGTLSFEALAGFVACIDYLAFLSELPSDVNRRTRLAHAFQNIANHEVALSQYFFRQLALLEQVEGVPPISLFGIKDPQRFVERTPTFALQFEGVELRNLSEYLGEHGVCVWDGNFYAQGLYEQLGLTDKGGVLRIGCMHYNSEQELAKLFKLLTAYFSKPVNTE